MMEGCRGDESLLAVLPLLLRLVQAKMQSGGEAETRTPEVGFPGSSE